METLEQEKMQKNAEIFNCKICDFISSNRYNYDLHLSTRKHKIRTQSYIFEQKIMPKNAEKFYCHPCDFLCSKKSNYDTHILTRKHQIRTNSNGLEKQEEKKCHTYLCSKCGKQYLARSGLWYHYKKCQSTLLDNYTEKGEDIIDTFDILQNVNINKTTNENKAITDTQQLKDLVLKLVEQNQDLTKQIVELSKQQINSVNVNNNGGNINSNNKFNLNVFLNQKCKHALNISDFVDTLVVSIKDLEETSRVGYAEGISKIFINALKRLDIYQRPVHCSDLKREILYVKDKNKWEKEDNEKNILTKAIKNVANKNIKQISEWQKLHPDYNDPDSRANDKYMKMLCEAMSGNTEEEQQKNYTKVIKNITKEVVIDKN
jgi:hypothetical protein